jgi:hypothetical protein
MLSVLRKFLGHVLPAVLRPLRILWNEMIGFVFLVLALLFTVASRRMIGEFDGSPGDILKLVVTASFVLLLAYYGISSFRRARKISRS